MTPPAPITVVSGVPRSGTSLAMQMLVAGGLPALTDAQRAPDEDNPRGYYEFEGVKHLRTDASWLPRAEGRVVKVIHLLLAGLPLDRPYRVLFLQRELREVVRSQAAMLARTGHGGGALPPERLLAIYAQQIAQARRWLAAHACFTTLEVPYAELVAAPSRWAGRMNEFLGGTLDVAAMARAVDPALHRNRTAPP